MMDVKPPRLSSRWTSDLFDRLALLIVQPGVAALALWGLATNSEAANDVSRPLFIWGGVALTCLVFASAYKHLGLVDEGRLVHGAGAALYFSVTAWTTVGYGDVLATPLARPFAAVQALVGMIYNSSLLGLVIYASTTHRTRPPASDHGAE